MNVKYDFDTYYREGKAALASRMTKYTENFPEIVNNHYPEGLEDIIADHFAMYAHAYCTDNDCDRKNLAEHVVGLLKNLSR